MRDFFRKRIAHADTAAPRRPLGAELVDEAVICELDELIARAHRLGLAAEVDRLIDRRNAVRPPEPLLEPASVPVVPGRTS